MNSTVRALVSGLLVLIMLTGIGFRFYNLDKKVFWMDETYSAHWIAGYSLRQIQAELSEKPEWSPQELERFQRLTPGNGVGATLHALVTDDPKHPPLFYVLLRTWSGLAGDSVFAFRLLPALLSLLMFPALWWLCRELFMDDPNRDKIILVALTLLAVSPFHVLYAQETREYSLWATVLVAVSAVFIHALRAGNRNWWIFYAFSLAVGVYTHTISILLWAAHAVTVGMLWWRQRQKATEDNVPATGNLLLPFGLASLGGGLLFAPWALQILAWQDNLSNTTSWLTAPSSLSYLTQTWISLPGLIFFDPNQTQRWNLPAGILAWAIPSVRIIRVALCALVLWALIFTWRHAPKRSSLFIAALALVPFLAVAVPDVLLGGYRSTIARFAIPCLLSGQLAVAYFIATRLANPVTQRRGTGIFAALICAGLVSCLLSSQAEVWWNKTYSYYVPQTARVINARKKPLVVLNLGSNFLALSRRLKPDVALFILDEDKIPDDKALHNLLTRENDTVFFYNPLPETKDAVRKHGAILKASPSSPELWELEKT